jgi:hypothetical protein
MKITTLHEGRMGPLGRFVITVLVLVVIVLGAVFFAVRTDGGRAFVEDRLANRLGMPLSIGRARIGWPYRLVLEQVETEGFGEEAPGFRVQDVRLGLGWRLHPRLTVRRAVVQMVRSRDDRWTPEALTRLGEAPFRTLRDLSRAVDVLGRHTELHVTESGVRWLDATGYEMASANGLSYHLQSARVPGRRARHHALTVYHAVAPGGQRVHDVEREWLATEERPYIELAATGATAPEAGAFWGGTP